MKRFTKSEKFQANQRKYQKSPKGRAAASNGRKVQRKRRDNDIGLKLMEKMRQQSNKAIKKKTINSDVFSKFSSFSNSKSFRNHLESTFSEGMSFSNYGFGDGKWVAGHRIALSMFNPNNEDDIRSCWNKTNIKAQWWRDNLDSRVELPPYNELVAMKSIWPRVFHDCELTTQRRKELEKRAFSGKLY